jgi:hypothetical protein
LIGYPRDEKARTFAALAFSQPQLNFLFGHLQSDDLSFQLKFSPNFFLPMIQQESHDPSDFRQISPLA